MTHEGKVPNPMEVILTAQNLSCRFKEAFNIRSNHNRQKANHRSTNQAMRGPWDLIIKVAEARSRYNRRAAFAYEASDLQGRLMFSGITSCVTVAADQASSSGSTSEGCSKS